MQHSFPSVFEDTALRITFRSKYAFIAAFSIHIVYAADLPVLASIVEGKNALVDASLLHMPLLEE